MIKKHLITCSVILVLFIVSQLFICSTNFKRKAVSVTTTTVDEKAVNSIPLFIRYNKDANDEINFADESTPVNNTGVTRKLNRSIRANSYRNIGSDVLHKKAKMLFPIIEPILKIYGIPEDFKYIPLVESGLSSGTSVKGARGLWQFMPGTARTYGLKVNKNVDERLNVRKSTIAACIYLRELFGEYNNWTLTAAAYNLGTIKLNRAIRQNKKRNYYFMHLNAETGSYVYKLLAMKAIINKPDNYGYKNNYAWINRPDLLAAN
ncbi:lytic transglycosylase domain-containing protein [Mucilaginibacter mali]|uniref:Lytic transglycosylase domain-containing protein n=1 Tax=Mucilaginibacter mali TaxID=2740462 RepID=A0A7D4UGV1_9SPHI|nr:lytic transglycosylase domain-containing protein [Mucilaginibacter mali]QKJ32336.1 lytic transglycosylase domain-containing protein [Mucilaginibacter mali]